jgi:hypothetical protein
LPVLVPVAHQSHGDRVAVCLVAEQDVAEVLTSSRVEGLEEGEKLDVLASGRNGWVLSSCISIETGLVQSHFGGNHSIAPVGEVPVGPGSSDDLVPGRIIPRGQTFGSGTASHDVATLEVGERVTAGTTLVAVGSRAPGLIDIGPSTSEHGVVAVASAEAVGIPSAPQYISLPPA